MQSHTIVVHCMIYEGWKRWVMWHIVHSGCVSCYVVGLSVWLLIGVLDRRAQHEHTNRSAFELYTSWSMCHWSGRFLLQFNIQPDCRPLPIDNVSVGAGGCSTIDCSPKGTHTANPHAHQMYSRVRWTRTRTHLLSHAKRWPNLRPNVALQLLALTDSSRQISLPSKSDTGPE